MQLATPDVLLPSEKQRVFRASPFGSLIGFLVFAAPAWLALELVVPRLGELPAVGWLVLGPVLLIAGLIWVLVLSAFYGVFRSSLRSTNWILRVAPPYGIALNLRSYRNGHFSGDDPTVALIDFAEIRSARRVRERTVTERSESTVVNLHSYLELELGCDTEDLEIAIEIERTREAPELKRLGITSRTKHRHLPVRVMAPGVVRVDWYRGMLEALRPHVSIAAEHRIQAAPGTPPGTLDERLRALVERGERMAAVELARAELGLDLTEAVTRVEEAFDASRTAA